MYIRQYNKPPLDHFPNLKQKSQRTDKFISKFPLSLSIRDLDVYNLGKKEDQKKTRREQIIKMILQQKPQKFKKN